MKISTVRGLLVALDVSLCAGIGGVVYREYEAKDARPQDKQAYLEDIARQLKAQDEATAQPTRREPYHWLATDLATRKKEEAPLEKPEPTADKVDVTPLENLVVVRGVLAGSELSIVHILPKDEKLKDEAGFFQVGHVVEFANGAEVKEILRDKVIFDYQGQEVALGIEPYEVIGSSEASAKATGGAKEVSGAPVPLAVLNNPGSWVQHKQDSSRVTITKTGVSAVKQHGDKVLEGVVWDSKDRGPDGKRSIRVTKLPPKSALRSGGLQEGDSVHSINGVRMSTKAEIVSYVKANPNLPQYRVTIIRRGKKITRSVVVKRR